MFNSIKRFLNRNKWAKVAAAVLAVVLVVGVVLHATGTAATPIDFAVGGLDTKGQVLYTNNSIYTKRAIPLDGLVIEPDFGAKISYSLYFYNEDGTFKNSMEDLTGKFVADLDDTTAAYHGATACRIEITPKDDKEVSALEIAEYASKLSIKNK